LARAKSIETSNPRWDERGAAYDFDVVSNPEFLREGSAVYDFTHADRIVLGVESLKARQRMTEVYGDLKRNGISLLFTNIETAELIKYGANAFLAMKVTFMNEMAQLCEKVGADVLLLAQGIGMDKRIGPDFLRPVRVRRQLLPQGYKGGSGDRKGSRRKPFLNPTDN
jgi:UDPglucose 6-dehydrogenase